MCLYARIGREPSDEGSMCDHASLSTGAGADQARSRGEVAGVPFARLRNMEREQAAKGPRHAGLALLGCCLAGCALVIAVAAGRGSSAAEAGALLRAMPAAQQCKEVAALQAQYPWVQAGTDFFDGSHVVCWARAAHLQGKGR